MSALLLLALAASAADAPRPFKGVSALEVRAEGGDVRVLGGDGPDAAVTVLAPDAAACLVTLDQAGGILRLRARRKKKLGLAGCHAGFEVRLPRTASVKLAAGSGLVRVESVAGDVSLDAGSGSVQAQDVSGAFSARLGSGGLKGFVRSKSVTVRAGSGAVDLDGLRGSASVSAGSGSIMLAWDDAPAGALVDVKSGSGDVALQFPEKTAVSAQIKTGSGRVRSDFSETPGGVKISARSGSGDVTLARRGAAR